MADLLTKEEIEALASLVNYPTIIGDADVRARLRRLKLIEAAPHMRKYRQMPYRLTEAGRAALTSETSR